MLELIDRQAVLTEIEKFKVLFNETMDSHKRVAYLTADHCMLVIKAASTIEAEPVRHGRWIDGASRGSYSIYCSYCGSHKETICPSEYCPTCGARMDADKIAEMRAAADDYAEY